MVSKSKKSRRSLKETETKLLLSGVLLLVLWPLLAGPFSASLFICNIMTSESCTALGGSWANLLNFGPSVVGAFLVSLSMVYGTKLQQATRVLCVILGTIVLSFLAYWATWVWMWVSPVHLFI